MPPVSSQRVGRIFSVCDISPASIAEVRVRELHG